MKNKMQKPNNILFNWFLIVVGLTSCSSIKTIEHREIKIPENFNNQNSKLSESYEIVSRSDFFKDPYLKVLIDEALEKNQELKIAEQTILAYEAEIKAKKGEYLPFVGISTIGDSEKVGEFTRNGSVEKQLSLNHEEFPEPLKNLKIGLSASWELDVWKKLRNQKQAAFREFLASWEAQRFLTSQLVSEISSSYYDLITLDMISINLHKYNELQSNALKTVKLLKQAGKSNELAVKRFEAELDRNQNELVKVNQEIIDLENELRFLIGNPNLIIDRPKSFLSLPSLISTSSIETSLLLNRPDIKKAEQELEAAKLDVKSARAAFFPTIEIGGSYGREAFKRELLSLTPESLFYKLALDILSPVFNLSQLKSNLKIANVKQEQSILEYEKVSLKAYLEVSSQLWRIENLQEQLRLQEDQMHSLEEANRISTILFSSARADYLEVLLTQRESLEARNQWIDSQKELIDANIDLYKSLGGGWY